MRHVARDPVAPSEGPAVALAGGFGRPRALREDEIESILDAFAAAAKTSVEAGFDGVQIHAAHGYLVSQFLSPLVNRRTDRWGGSLENRARFLLEAVRRVRAVIGASRTIAVKLNSSDFQKGGFAPEECREVACMLDAEGIDLLELSGGNYESPALLGIDARGVKRSTAEREAYFLEYATMVRGSVRVPVMLTGGMRSRGAMERAIESGAIDVVGLARPLCLEPDLPRRLLSGACDAAIPFARPRASLRLLEAAAETGFYVVQIARLADGRAPSHDVGANAAAISYVGTDLRRGLARSWFGE
jgi:2,4-dienoyl-CoA reductase-like NADH-dependent reductase (Old Yellow Enzyme family)